MLKPKVFILDVDGVMTDGKFYYSDKGKQYKIFGPDDHDALHLLNPFLDIVFISGDKKGFSISKKRIAEDMGFPLFLVSTKKRYQWISERWDLNQVIYMGDGIFDSLVFDQVAYGIATSGSDFLAQKKANFITKRIGSERAVSEACIHILSKFFADCVQDDPLSRSILEVCQPH